jgi:hypothetical protein
MNRILLLTSAFCLARPLHAAEDSPAYRDATKPWSERVDDLLGRMTIEEKAPAMLQA